MVETVVLERVQMELKTMETPMAVVDLERVGQVVVHTLAALEHLVLLE